MAAQTGYPSLTGNILYHGNPKTHFLDVETATNMYPGRLVTKGTYESDAIVNTGVTPPFGWLGYEGTRLKFKKESKDTIFTINDEAVVYGSGSYAVRAKLAAAFAVVGGDYAIPWSSGRVAPAVYLPANLGGGLAIRVPYEKKTAAFDTSIDFIAKQIIGLPQVYPVTANASGTIDVGLGDSGSGQEAGYDADGLVDGLTIPTAGTYGVHNMVDATAANITVGVLLDEVQIKDATETPVYTPILLNPGLQCDGTLVSLEYTTSNHTQTGYIFVPVASPGTIPVGRFPYTTAISASDQNVAVENMIA